MSSSKSVVSYNGGSNISFLGGTINDSNTTTRSDEAISLVDNFSDENDV